MDKRPIKQLWCGRCHQFHDNWHEIAPDTWRCRNLGGRGPCGYCVSWNPNWGMRGIERDVMSSEHNPDSIMFSGHSHSDDWECESCGARLREDQEVCERCYARFK